MKKSLRYQLSEYDCGPTSMLNALAFLFEREDIPPEAVRNIMLYCLDCYGSDGVSGKSGTSCAAMMFLSNWLNGFGKIGRLHISAVSVRSGGEFRAEQPSARCTPRCGGAAVVRLHFDGEHYVTLTGIDENDMVRVFDPYYLDQPLNTDGVQMVYDHPCEYNRLVPRPCFRQTHEVYALGEIDTREAILLFNDQTRLTAENTIEYMI